MLKDPSRQVRIQISRPGDYDREQIERAREVIKAAKRVLEESDPSILLGGWYRREPHSKEGI
jgi:hypothetical protein